MVQRQIFIIKFITVVALGVLELWVAIPAGTALNLHPLLNGIASALGSVLGAIAVIILGERLRNWLLRNKKKEESNRGWIYKTWDKYGVIGLGLLSPLLTGALLGAALGISLGAVPKRLIVWMSIGIIVWTILLTSVSTLGFEFFKG